MAEIVLRLQSRLVIRTLDDDGTVDPKDAADMVARVLEVVRSACSNGTITGDSPFYCAHSHEDARLEAEDEVSTVLHELCMHTDTFPWDWEEEDGPDSKCGTDHYFKNKEDPDDRYWVNDDNGHITVHNLNDEG